jgi:hypothetical protein
MTKEDSKIVTRTDNSMKKKLKEESAAFFSPSNFKPLKKYVQQFMLSGILRYEAANKAGKGKKLRKKLKQIFTQT